MNSIELTEILNSIDESGQEISFTMELEGGEFKSYDGFIYKRNENQWLICNDVVDGGWDRLKRHGFKYGRTTSYDGGFFGHSIELTSKVYFCKLCGIIINKSNDGTCDNCTKLINDFKGTKPIEKKEANPFVVFNKGRVDVVADIPSQHLSGREEMWARGLHTSADGRIHRLNQMNETHLRNTIERFRGEFNVSALETELLMRQAGSLRDGPF